MAVAAESVQAVRHFNRLYTRQIGVLQEHLLDSQFSLTEVRVLYELAHRENLTAAELRQDLGLDRGYLSRMLQRFEKQGWITAKASPQDRRKFFLSLTAKGRKVFAPLDRRSSEQVADMLTKLSASQHGKMLRAMQEIECALSPKVTTVKSYTLRQHCPGDMGWVVQRHGELYWQEYHYDVRFEALVARIVADFVENLDPARERCWIAERDGERVGSVFLVQKSKSVSKLRLLLVEPTARGLGIGGQLVAECMGFAREAGYRKMILWTQSELTAARVIYQKAGFKLTAKKRHDSWSREKMVAETWELRL